MELNLSTFLLEIINFLVLVWILKRFFYKPVLQVIRNRREEIEHRVSESHRIETEAEELHVQYQNRLADWEQERATSREQLAHELEQIRTEKMETLQQEIQQEREKQAVIDRNQLAKQQHELELRALKQAAAFSARLLSQGAGAETEIRLIELLLEDLQQLSEEQTARIRNHWGESVNTIRITTAYPLAEEMRAKLEDSLHRIVADGMQCQYFTDPELHAGIVIAIGAWTISLNLRDELQSFSEFTHDPR